MNLGSFVQLYSCIGKVRFLSRPYLSFSSESSRKGAWVSFEVVGSWDKSRSLFLILCLKKAYIKVSVMAKQKKERELFYHNIIKKKWALEQVFL